MGEPTVPDPRGSEVGEASIPEGRLLRLQQREGPSVGGGNFSEQSRQGKDEAALSAFRQALTDAEALNNLALAKELVGRPDDARRLYRDALEADPKLREALDNLSALETRPPPPAKEMTP